MRSPFRHHHPSGSIPSISSAQGHAGAATLLSSGSADRRERTREARRIKSETRQLMSTHREIDQVENIIAS